MARKEWPKFTVSDIGPELVERLVKHVKRGSTPAGAARIEGIPARRFRRWYAEGLDRIEDAYDAEDENLLHHRQALMVLALEKAMAEEAQRLGRQVRNGHEEWRAKLAWLERQERDDFAASEKVDVDVTVTVKDPAVIEGRVAAIGGALRILEASRARAVGGVVRPALPPARDVLPDPAEDQRAADGVPAE